jgi:DNA-binding NtrC family response regulator
MDYEHRILIIEEDLPLKQTLVHIFLREGFQVISTAVNFKAMDQLKEGSFDLVVLDIKNTHDRGLSLFFRIKRDYPHMPVILLSTSPDSGVIPGIDKEYLWVKITQPFEPLFLLKTTCEMIDAALVSEL